MPDLSQTAVVAWIAARDPAALRRVRPASFEQDKDCADAALRLGDALDRAAARDPAALRAFLVDPAVRPRLQRALAQIGMARRLRLYDWFAEAGLPDVPGLHAALMDPPNGFPLRAEVTALLREGLLRRVFDPGRLAALRDALRRDDAA